MQTSAKRGFTLIELLVVIAIIGILSSVVLASLNTARVKARVAAAQATAKSVQAAAIICLDSGVTLNAPNVGQPICAASTTVPYPALPTVGGWVYSSTTSSVQAGTFSFTVTGDSKIISCNQDSCSTN